MKIGFLTALTVLLTATGLTVAQPEVFVPPTTDVSWDDSEFVYQYWGYGEYLLWKVTSVPVFLPGGLDYGYNSGFRTGMGVWFDTEKDLGAELNFLYLPPIVANYDAVSFAGAVSNSLWGFEANLRTGDYGVSGLTFDFLAGFRNVNFQERWFDTTTAGNTVTRDWIRTRNHFYGGQAGTIVDWALGPVFASGSAKLAVGCLHELDTGFGTSIDRTTGVVTPGGLFVSPSPKNINRTKAVLVPEFDVQVGLQPASWVRTSVGYNWLAISRVARPADLTGIPFIDTGGIWYQGLNFNLEFRF